MAKQLNPGIAIAMPLRYGSVQITRTRPAAIVQNRPKSLFAGGNSSITATMRPTSPAMLM